MASHADMIAMVQIQTWDSQVGLEERRVVISTVPHHDVCFLLGLPKNHFVVHAGVHDKSMVEERFVFLTLLP